MRLGSSALVAWMSAFGLMGCGAPASPRVTESVVVANMRAPMNGGGLWYAPDWAAYGDDPNDARMCAMVCAQGGAMAPPGRRLLRCYGAAAPPGLTTLESSRVVVCDFGGGR
ncbi:MAG: hypothetical protein U0271_07185 [Polyangiaceae bacterium]